MIKTNRLVWLDYLRGLCAISIMLHHYLAWTTNFESARYTTRIGLYGVSLFYILSGLTLYLVYKNKFKFNIQSISSFFIKRIFRIFPLLWLVTFVAIILKGNNVYVDWFLNFSGLFGFFSWAGGIATGVWSIGNELVFYAFFPFLLFFAVKNRNLFILTGLLILAIYLYFAFSILPKNTSLNWKDYVNPLNQLFLFYGGIAIGLFFEKIKLNNYYLVIILLISILFFVFYPVSGDRLIFVSSYNRLIFTLLCLSICLCFFKIDWSLPRFLEYPLAKFGEATYSIYLIHPIIWEIVGLKLNNSFFKMIVSVILTILISLFIYYKIEKKFIHLGSRIVAKINE